MASWRHRLLLSVSLGSHLLTTDRELRTETGAPAAVLPADQPVVGGLLEAVALVAHHHRAAPRLVPHRVPGGETAVRDAGLAAHHRLAGRPVSRGVTEPPPVPENISEVENISVSVSTDLQTSLGGPTR